MSTRASKIALRLMIKQGLGMHDVGQHSCHYSGDYDFAGTTYAVVGNAERVFCVEMRSPKTGRWVAVQPDGYPTQLRNEREATRALLARASEPDPDEVAELADR